MNYLSEFLLILIDNNIIMNIDFYFLGYST